jgi:hypothetical protein
MAEHMVEFGKGVGRIESDGRLDAPAFHRNHEPIWAVLGQFLHGRSGHVVETGSGTGQHVVYFAQHSPDIVWWPSDLNAHHLNSIAAWRAHANLPNIRAPLWIDLADFDWPRALRNEGGLSEVVALFCANVIHIAPWRVAEGLFAGASKILCSDGRLFVYGPFKRNGKHTALSNAVFDTSLRLANTEWGVRDIADLEALATRNRLILREIRDMPANNMILVFARAGSK